MESLNTQILKNAAPLLKAGVSFEANAMQRHYPSQRAHPIDDAQMKFKLETSLPKRGGAVKRQPE